MNNLGRNITILRKKRRVTQADIALQLEKHANTISNWEHELSMPNVDELIKLSNILGVTLDILIKGDLENVHLSEFEASGKNEQNVQLNVQDHVQLNTMKGKKEALIPDQPGNGNGVVDELLKRVNSLEQRLIALEQERNTNPGIGNH